MRRAAECRRGLRGCDAVRAVAWVASATSRAVTASASFDRPPARACFRSTAAAHERVRGIRSVRGGAAPAAVPAGAVASAAPSRWFVVCVYRGVSPLAVALRRRVPPGSTAGVAAACGLASWLPPVPVEGSPLASVWLWRFWVLPLRGLVRRMVLAGVGCLGFVVVVVLGLLGFSAVGGARGFCRPFFVLAPLLSFFAASTSIRVDIGSKPTTRLMPVDMPVDSTMGSKHAKGSREVAAPKRPGPTPALPPKRQRKADAHAARVEKMNNHNERKKL